MHNRIISDKVFQVRSNLLFALFAACTKEVELLTIKSGNNHLNLYMIPKSNTK